MDDNKSRFMQFAHEFWEQQDVSVIDRYVQQDCVIHTPLTMAYGSMTLQEIAAKWFQAFPDLLLFFRDTIAEDITIPEGTNGLSSGPVTIADGYEITVRGDWAIV